MNYENLRVIFNLGNYHEHEHQIYHSTKKAVSQRIGTNSQVNTPRILREKEKEKK